MGFGLMILLKDMNIVVESLKRRIYVHFNKHDHMHSSLKPPLSSNFPAVYKLGFLFCGGGGTAFFKKDRLWVYTQRRPLMLAQGRARLVEPTCFSPAFLVAQRSGSSSLSLVLQPWADSFSLHSSLMPSV